MKAQLDNVLMSSMIMWIDNTILKRGEAFQNYNSQFYPITNIYNGFYSYGLPFKQVVSDSSVSGANLLSGVYVNNSFITVGQSGLTGINPFQGQVYFTGNQAGKTLSGTYAVKDFNIYLTNQPEEELLFETEYKIRPKTTQNPTGLAIESITYPCIFLKNNGGTNEPFALGGQDQTMMEVRAVVLADNMFNLDAVCSLLKDTARKYVPLINNSPFNVFGALNSGYFNYNSLTSGIDVSNDAFYITEVNISKIFANLNTKNNQVFPAFVDFTLSNIRYPRC
jgi:hypothetical protein